MLPTFTGKLVENVGTVTWRKTTKQKLTKKISLLQTRSVFVVTLTAV